MLSSTCRARRVMWPVDKGQSSDYDSDMRVPMAESCQGVPQSHS